MHGELAAKRAAQTAKDTFEGKGFSLNLPEIKVKEDDIKKGISILDFLSKNNITSSKSEARRAIANKGLKINNILVEDEKKILRILDFNEKSLKMSFGKKKHYVVKII